MIGKTIIAVIAACRRSSDISLVNELEDPVNSKTQRLLFVMAVPHVLFSPNYTMSVIAIGLSAFYILYLLPPPPPPPPPMVAKPRNYMLISVQ